MSSNQSPFAEPLERRTLFAAGVLRNVTTDFGGDESSLDLAVMKDGRVVVLGRTEGDASEDFFVARFTADGSPDFSFGRDGVVRADFPGTFDAAAVAVGTGGAVFVAGVSGDAFAVVRLDGDGDINDDYGDGGLAVVDAGTQERIGDLAVDSKNSAVILGDAVNESGRRAFAVARLTKGGSPDARFGEFEDGLAVVDFPADLGVTATAVALDKGGKIVLGGTTSTDTFALARLNRDGPPDQKFGDGGRVVVNNLGQPAALRSIALAKGSRIIAAGDALTPASTPDQLVLAQFTKSGDADDDFGGGDGVTLTDFAPGQAEFAAGASVDSKGRIYLGGVVTEPGDGDGNRFLLARYTKGGNPDLSFNASGRFLTDVIAGPDSVERATNVAVQRGGTVVLLGDTVADVADSGSRDLALVRYTEKLGPSGSVRLTGKRDDVLLVRGTSKDDVITVTPAPDGPGPDADPDAFIQVVINGEAFELFASADVEEIEVEASGGDDEVTITDDQADLIFVAAGSGDDVVRVVGSTDADLRGGRGDDKLFGGDGDDDLDGGRDEDRLIGNGGDDFFFAFDGYEDDIDGGSGEDEADADDFDETASVRRLFF